MTSEAEQITALHSAAQEAMRQGDLRQAHQHCLAILKLDARFADAWFLCGVIAGYNRQTDKAVEILEKATNLAAHNPEYRAELAKQLLAAHHPDRALQEATAAWSRSPTSLPVLNTLGTVFSHAGEYETALACYERAITELRGAGSELPDKWQADLYFNTAASLQFAGRFDEAETAYEQAITLHPDFFKAHAALSTLKRQTKASNHLQRLESLRDRVKTPRDQLRIGHAIAKELEDLECYEDAFTSLQWAKRALAENTGYRAADDGALFAGLRALFTPDVMQAGEPGSDSREPIFIVGMPRTGTTLLEQVLSSHSLVFGAGELQNFPLQVRRMSGSRAPGLFDLSAIEKALQVNPLSLGTAYLDSTRPRTGHTPHFIDKLPLNFIFIGLIRRSLPNAKLVCLRRDPMDTCLSNYRQIFAANFRHYQYNLDLLDCGRYYIEFDRTMQHWHELMPGAIHEVQYETLVQDTEQTARALLEYCELDWEEQCLAFSERDTSIATPSAVQVRRGIYGSSVNRWQRYGKAMQPLYDLLAGAGLYD